MLPPALVKLAHAIEARDPFTAGHLWRMQCYAEALARALDYNEPEREQARAAALLHDLGKIALPETILARKGLLEDEEIAWMRRHPRIGFELLSDQGLPEPVLEAVLHHHERWDGIGYPDRLKNEAIPELARLIALCDAYDNMTSWRPYRKAPFAPSRTLIELSKHAERQFDPRQVKLFSALVAAGELSSIYGCSAPRTRVARCPDCGAVLPFETEHEAGAALLCPGCRQELAIESRSGLELEIKKTGRKLSELPP